MTANLSQFEEISCIPEIKQKSRDDCIFPTTSRRHWWLISTTNINEEPWKSKFAKMHRKIWSTITSKIRLFRYKFILKIYCAQYIEDLHNPIHLHFLFSWCWLQLMLWFQTVWLQLQNTDRVMLMMLRMEMQKLGTYIWWEGRRVEGWWGKANLYIYICMYVCV